MLIDRKLHTFKAYKKISIISIIIVSLSIIYLEIIIMRGGELLVSSLFQIYINKAPLCFATFFKELYTFFSHYIYIYTVLAWLENLYLAGTNFCGQLSLHSKGG